MKNFFGQRGAELVITFLSFCFCVCFFSFVTDDYGAFSWSQAAGQFSNYPMCEFYWGTLGIGKIFTILYHRWPEYNWTGGAMIAAPVFGLYLALRAVKNIIFRDNQSVVTIRGIQVLFALFFTQNIISLNATRPAVFFCGIGAFNLLFSEKPDKRSTVINNLIFITGMLLRPESGIGMLLLTSLGHLIYRFDLIHLLKRTFFPAVVITIMFCAYFIDWSHTNQFLKKVEPEVEYKLMEKRVVGIAAQTTSIDSIKYQAAAAGLCFDTRVLTPDYFRSILLPGADLSFSHARARFFHVLSLYKYYSFILCYTVSLILLCFFQQDYVRRIFKIILFNTGAFIIIYSTDYTGSLVSGRHFLNIQLISILITSFYFFRGASYPLKQNTPLAAGSLFLAVTLGCLLLVAWGTVETISAYNRDSDDIADATHCYESAMQRMDNLYSNRIIVLTTNSFRLFDHTYSFKNKVYKNNTYLMFDVWTHYLYPEYLAYLGKECNCDPLDPVTFFNWLSAKNALYIAEPWRHELTAKYMKVVHGQKLKFVPNAEYITPPCISNTNVREFELRKVVVDP